MKQLYLSFAFLVISSISLSAATEENSKTEVWAEGLTEDVLSLRIVNCGNWMLPPVITLDSDETLEFSFDMLSHYTRTYTYHIDHCDANWNKSDLMYSEYMDGFDNEQLEPGVHSQNTTYQYIHYSFTFPNSTCSPKISGNYQLTISHDNIPDAVFRFCVSEQTTELKYQVSDVTDIDTRKAHQQVTAKADAGDLSCFDAAEELRLTVMQNMRFDNAARAMVPDLVEGSTISWQHCKPLIFDAGNGFRRFEVTDVYANTQNVDRITFMEPYYHVYLKPGEPMKSHYYDADHNGRYIVRSTQNGVTDSDTEADYVFVHFELYSEMIEGGALYVFYQYDGAGFAMRQQMEFKGTRPHCYAATILMKMGSYDYQYLWLPENSRQAQTGPFEGNFYQTDNEYQLFLYQRRPGERYDRLVGYSNARRMSE